MMRDIAPPPDHFDGKYSQFFERYVEPCLPTPNRVQAFDTLLRHHISSDNPTYVTRYVRGQSRGVVCLTADGGRILPTDNAPVWWLHALLLSKVTLPENAETMFASMPDHFFDVARTSTLNSVGFHAAHILSAKNRNIDWHNWSSDELARRMLVNIHPCNMFLVAKQEWTRNGGRADIIRWVINAYRHRYGATMDRFLADCDPDYSLKDQPPDDPAYSYKTTATAGNSVTVVQANRPMIKKRLVGHEVLLEISIDGSQYLLPHDDLVAWAREHTTALETASWVAQGIYSWPRATSAIMQFLHHYQSPLR